MNEGSKKMLDEILAKPVNMLDEYDIQVLKARRSYLTNAQQKEYAEVLEDKPEKVDYSKMTVAELKSVCEERGLEIPEGAKKVEIVELIENSEEK